MPRAVSTADLRALSARFRAMDDSYDFTRFVAAQRGSHDQALAELKAGHKRSHWMWFIFPQIAGLGFSAMARRYAISSLDEARAYLQHPVLSPRLQTCTAAINQVTRQTVNQVFGSPDEMKFHSSMTLFGCTAPADPAFRRALAMYFGGEEDLRTFERLSAS